VDADGIGKSLLRLFTTEAWRERQSEKLKNKLKAAREESERMRQRILEEQGGYYTEPEDPESPN